MELLLSLVIGAAVACVIFVVGHFLLRSKQPLAQTEAIAEEAKLPAQPVAERPAEVVPSTETILPAQRSSADWKPIGTSFAHANVVTAASVAAIPRCIAFL